ncbi:hypothetical protein RO21_04435 [[Actinobacillus] muris]|uniref:Uncharacterized protein n=1 Tax=Muribacter muris TaxID=67855 RepID=A0A0J5S4R9_9PAST|nr:hypothetical protein [Muribacter muris]KMK51787.1 hypothetical protein RO21_04435 [[Actinobacillus] muris] [Muribacter muris]
MTTKNQQQIPPRQQETRCIYLPGEPVDKLVRGCNYQIVLGAVQEIVFNFNSQIWSDLSVDILPSQKGDQDFRLNAVYDVKQKKLISGGFAISNRGVPYHIKVSRYFDGTFVVKSKDIEIGRYRVPPSSQDTDEYDKPAVWLDPLYVGFSDLEDLNAYYQLFKQHQEASYNWLQGLDQFHYSNVLKPPYLPNEIKHSFDELWTSNGMQCVKNEAKEVIVLLVLEEKSHFEYRMEDPFAEASYKFHRNAIQKAEKPKTLKVAELEEYLSEKDFNELISYVAMYNNQYSDEWVVGSTTASYMIENKHWLNALNRTVEVKWIKGYLAIVFKGYNPPFGFTHAGLAHIKLKGITGGIHLTKDIKRVWISAQNVIHPKAVLKDTISGKLAKLGLVLDFIGDYETVMLDEEGSRNIAELIGRIGISFGGAIATTVISNISLTLIMRLIPTGIIIPVIGIIIFSGLVIIGTAYFISKGSSIIKDSIWK